MGTIKRFLFENRNFDPDYDPNADHSYQYDDDEDMDEESNDLENEDELIEEPPVPTFSEEEVLAAQQTAFDEGKTAGLQEATKQIEHLLASALTQIAQSVSISFQEHKKQLEIHEQEALSIAVSVVKKLIPAYCEKHGSDEIIDVVTRCLEPLRSEPRLIVKVNENIRDEIQERLTKIADDHGYDGRVVVMGNSEILAGDCRVEWSDGGAERNKDELWQKIDEIIERNLTREGNTGDTEPM